MFGRVVSDKWRFGGRKIIGIVWLFGSPVDM